MNLFPKCWKILCEQRDYVWHLIHQFNDADQHKNELWDSLADIEDAICEINPHYQRQFTKKEEK